MRLSGRLGQVVGPFTVGKQLFDDDGAIGALTPETTRPILFKLGIQAEPGTTMLINNKAIKVGKTGIYQLDEVINITSLKFTSETDENTLVDFCY